MAPLERERPFAPSPLWPLADKINPTLTRQGLAVSQPALSKHGNKSFIVHTTGNDEFNKRQNTPDQKTMRGRSGGGGVCVWGGVGGRRNGCGVQAGVHFYDD